MKSKLYKSFLTILKKIVQNTYFFKKLIFYNVFSVWSLKNINILTSSFKLFTTLQHIFAKILAKYIRTDILNGNKAKKEFNNFLFR